MVSISVKKSLFSLPMAVSKGEGGKEEGKRKGRWEGGVARERGGREGGREGWREGGREGEGVTIGGRAEGGWNANKE